MAFADGRMDDAVRYHTRSLELRMRLFGIDHAATESSIFNLAEDAIEMKRPAQARAALADLGKRISTHSWGGRAWYEIKLGDIARLENDLPGALEHHRAAIAIYDAAGEHSDPELATPLVEAGRDLLAMGRPREAIAPLEIAEVRRAPAGDGAITEVWLELGRAYFGAGRAARGRALILKAQEVCRSHPDSTDPETLAAATAWLAAHGA